MKTLPVRAYGAVVWDWNGTLLDDAALCVDCMNALLRPRGLPELTPARYRELFRFPVVEYYRALGFDFERDPFARIGLEFMDQYECRRVEAPLHAGTRAALAAVAAAGVPQFVLSAYHEHRLGSLLAHHGLTDRFAGIAGGEDDYAHGKTARGRAWRASQRELHGARLLLIGDTDHDAEVAAELGADCWLVCGGHQSSARLRAVGVPVFDALGELPLGPV